MKIGRVFTLLGGIVLLLSAGLHTVGYYRQIPKLLSVGATPSGVGQLLRVFWLSDTVQFAALGLVVLFARNSAAARPVVLTCALACVANALLLIGFVGIAPPVYIFLVIAILLFVGGAAPQGAKVAAPSA